MAPSQTIDRKADWWALLAIALGGVVLACVVLVRLPLAPGFWMDDGVYLATGKALAEGQGYRHIELPGMPWQTKYPPGYPLVLAALWKTIGTLEGVLRGVAIVNVVCWTGAAMIAFVMARRQWGLSVWLAGAAGLMVVFEPQSLDLHNSAMSENVFALLSVAALACCGKMFGRRMEQRPRWELWAAACAVLAVASIVTRSVGIACVAACVGAPVLARRWQPAVAIGAICGALVGGFWIWRGVLAERNAAIPETAHLGYDLDYKLWLAGDVSSLSWSAWINTGDLLLSVTQRVMPWQGEWVEWCIAEGWVTQSLYLAWCAMVWGCLVVGAVTAWKRSNGAVALYLAGSVVLMIVWPFPPARFVMPLTPVLAPVFVLGLMTAAGWVMRGAMKAATSVDAKRALAIGDALGERLAMGAVVVILAHAGLLVANAGGKTQIAEWGEQFEAGIALVKERTPSDAVVAAPSAAYLNLRTGRKVVILAPAEDPVGQRYPRTRAWRMMGTDALAVDEAYFKTLYETRLEGMYDGTGVTHVLVPSFNDARAKLMAEYFRTRGAKFSLVAEQGGFRLYEVGRGFSG